MTEDPWLSPLLDQHLTACYSRAMSITRSRERAEDAVEAAVRGIARMRDRWPSTDDLGPILMLATIVAAQASDRASPTRSDPPADER